MVHKLGGTDITTRQKLTRFGESGVYGFMNHMDSRDAAQLLLQSISTEARQQLIFRYVSPSLVVELQLIDCAHSLMVSSPCQSGLRLVFRSHGLGLYLLPTSARARQIKYEQ